MLTKPLLNVVGVAVGAAAGAAVASAIKFGVKEIKKIKKNQLKVEVYQDGKAIQAELVK